MATATTKPAPRRPAGSTGAAGTRAGATSRARTAAPSAARTRTAAPSPARGPERQRPPASAQPHDAPRPIRSPPPPTASRSAPADSPARARTATGHAAALRARRVFFRWLWLVYIPIALAVIAIIVAMTGILPRQATLPLIALIAWGAGGVWLIYERRRRMVRIAIPTSVLVGLISLGVLGLVGLLLAWMGTDRLASSSGPTLLVIGCFLLLVALFAPAFRLADAVMRFTFRTLVRLSKPPPAKARRPRPARRRVA